MGIDYTRSLLNAQNIKPTFNVPDEFQKKLGSGLSTTFVINRSKFDTKIGVAKVMQNIMTCLTTPVGRRFDQPDYGSTLYMLLMEEKTSKLIPELEQATEDALKAWIPAIIVEDVTVDYRNNNIVVIVLQFVIKGSLSREIVEIALSTNDNQVFSASIFTHNGIRFFGN